MEQLTFDSRREGVGEGFERYRELYGIGTDVDRTEGEFFASFRASRLDRLLVFDRRLSGLSHERTARCVNGSGFDHATVQLVHSGRLGVSIGEERRWIGAGDMVAFDMRRPQRTWTDGVHMTTVSLARSLFEGALPAAAQFHGRVFAGRAAPIVRDHIAALGACDVALEPAMAEAVTTSLGLMVGAMLGDGAVTTRAAEMAALKVRTAMRFIRAHIGRPDLSAELIADRIGVSRSVLYRMFEPHGGVARFIKRQRLLAMRQALSLPKDIRPISTLARDCGFVSDAHANRSFRDEFGVPPGEYRAAHNVADRRVTRSNRFTHWFDDFF